MQCGRIGGDEVMRTEMPDRDDRRFRWALVVAVVPGLWLAPAISRAQNPAPFATLTLYEVQEGTDLRPPAAPTLRLAKATLVGEASGGVCNAGQDPCDFHTMATSRVPLDKGFGPISGGFQVLFDTLMNPGHLLSDLVLTAEGTVQGTLDLRPVLSGTQPLAFLTGTWKSKKLGAQGTLSGTFFIPMSTIPTDPAASDPCPNTHFAYLDPSGLQCLTTTEFSLTRPVTKVVATFLKTGPFVGGHGGGEDHDDDREEGNHRH
jgi:hypothetical protein